MSEDTRRRVPQGEQNIQRTELLRPPVKTCKQKALDFFWDRDKKACLTRTPTNWCSITFYYAIFLVVTFFFLYISMVISEAVASRFNDRPQYVLDESLIGNSPSLNFFPMNGPLNLIWLSPKEDYSSYVDSISSEFEIYSEKNPKFNASDFAKCSSPPFGYNEKQPCIFLRMNRILMWKPRPFKPGDKFPPHLPKAVKERIQSASSPRVWITCNGTTAKDRDHIKEEFFEIQGESGFEPTGFPYTRQSDFVDPIVALKFSDPNSTKVLYSFTCTAWAAKLDPAKAKVVVNYYFE